MAASYEYVRTVCVHAVYKLCTGPSEPNKNEALKIEGFQELHFQAKEKTKLDKVG